MEVHFVQCRMKLEIEICIRNNKKVSAFFFKDIKLKLLFFLYSFFSIQGSFKSFRQEKNKITQKNWNFLLVFLSNNIGFRETGFISPQE